MDAASPQKNSRPWLSPDALADLLDELREAGHRIGVGHYLAAQKLVLGVLALGETLEDPRRLRSLLGPLLCSSPTEQQAFGVRFDAWLARYLPAEPAANRQAGGDSLRAELNVLERGSRYWLGGGILSIGVMLSVSVLYFRSHPGQLPWVATLLLLPLAVTIGYRLWLRYRALTFLERQELQGDALAWQLRFESQADELYPPLSLQRATRELRRRVEVPSTELDLGRTITRTVQAAGWFTPVCRSRQVVPEYVCLVDAVSHVDHQAAGCLHLVDRLVQQGVHATAYRFRGDFRTCFPSSGRHACSVPELAARHAEDRLLIFADGHSFFHPVTGRMHPWLRELDRWPHRALLTPVPETEWGRLEAEVSGAIRILPASIDGLTRFTRPARGPVRRLGNQIQATAIPGWDLLEHPGRWTSSDPPTPGDIATALEALGRTLGPGGMLWLRACAVYPELHWGLTLALGARLKNDHEHPLLEPALLSKLSRLPWLRQGIMPDWCRLHLINGLSPEQESRVRAALSELVLGAVTGSHSGFALEVFQETPDLVAALCRRCLAMLGRRSRPESPLRDVVFVRFMSGPTPTPLTLRLPDLVRRALARLRRSQRREQPPLPAWKRTLDLTILVLLSPVVVTVGLAVAALLKLSSPGPVLFVQERLGYQGRPFRLYKFRTMRTGAASRDHEDHVRHLISRDEPMRMLDEVDSRIIPLGGMLRASGLDELPQLLNVLRREMSLVGPRPVLPAEYDHYSPSQMRRFNCLPGLTGLWQVSGKNKTTFSQMVALDIEYAEKKSLRLDLQILLRTPAVLIRQLMEQARFRRAR